MSIDKWDIRFMELADHISTWSKDRNTKVGTVIVNNEKRIISTGFNGLPIGADDLIESRFEKENKYFYTEHAERNALYSALAIGASTKNAIIYVVLFPCADCARGIIQSGIKRVVCKNKPDFNNEKWGKSWRITNELFIECGIKLEFINE